MNFSGNPGEFRWIMRTAILFAAGLTIAGGCALKRPPYVVVPSRETRSEAPPAPPSPSSPPEACPVPAGTPPLPLMPEGRQLLQTFLDHDGRPGGPTVDESQSLRGLHQKVLDALQDAQNLAVQTNNSKARTFCEEAPKLCSQTSLFQKKPFVRQVVDARLDKPPKCRPLAVQDGNYWWIFYIDPVRQMMTHILLIRDVERTIERGAS